VADSRNDDRASIDHEYVVCYKKQDFVFKGHEIDATKYHNPDNDLRGPWTSGNLTGLANKQQRPNLHYDLVNPADGAVYPPSPVRGWACSPDTMGRLIAENRILWPAKPSGRPRLKQFLCDVRETQTGFSSFLSVGTTMDGTRAIQELFGEKVFPFSKPVQLLHQLLEQATSPESIVLDFFAGSGTTAQAVLELNQKEGTGRKFILVQLPEPTGRRDFQTIAEITKERTRRVIKKLNEEDSGKLDLNSGVRQDRGFRVFKLDNSNFNTWDSTPKNGTETAQRASVLADQLELHVNHIRPERTGEDLLSELLLKSGFPLATKFETLTFSGKTVYSVAEGAMLICLEKELTLEAIKAIADRKPERVVCLDEGFAGNDQLKTNAVQIMKTKGVTSFRTV
jgi:adenine-specific DNA-methyltransferase